MEEAVSSSGVVVVPFEFSLVDWSVEVEVVGVSGVGEGEVG